jgi:hypothetical protein
MKAIIWFIGGPSQKPRSSQYTHRTCQKLNSLSYPYKLTTNSYYSTQVQAKDFLSCPGQKSRSGSRFALSLVISVDFVRILY